MRGRKHEIDQKYDNLQRVLEETELGHQSLLSDLRSQVEVLQNQTKTQQSQSQQREENLTAQIRDLGTARDADRTAARNKVKDLEQSMECLEVDLQRANCSVADLEKLASENATMKVANEEQDMELGQLHETVQLMKNNNRSLSSNNKDLALAVQQHRESQTGERLLREEAESKLEQVEDDLLEAASGHAKQMAKAKGKLRSTVLEHDEEVSLAMTIRESTDQVSLGSRPRRAAGTCITSTSIEEA